MSSTTSEKSLDIRKIIGEYKKLDPTERFLDLMAVTLGLIFGINLILITSIKSIARTPANIAFMTLPLFMGGIILGYRIKLNEEGVSKSSIRKEFTKVTIGIFILHFFAVFSTWS